MSAKEAWTPYGLEAIRIRYLRRRRLLAILVGLTLAGVWALMFQTEVTSETEIFANGRRANTISIDEPDTPQERGPVRVSLDPGRVTRAESGGGEPSTSGITRTAAPIFERADPVPYEAYVFVYGPFVLLLLAGWFLAKKKGKHDQVNYGIYKGAMPLELVSASMSRHVFTTRYAKTSLFNKGRIDHLPEQLLQVERVPQEGA